MNDFTKKELCQIKELVMWRGTSKLLLKIQSLIDNYCEHECRCWDDVHNTRECIKCGQERIGEINDNQ